MNSSLLDLIMLSNLNISKEYSQEQILEVSYRPGQGRCRYNSVHHRDENAKIVILAKRDRGGRNEAAQSSSRVVELK